MHAEAQPPGVKKQPLAVALVTGAAGTTGAAIAARLEHEGHVVAGVDLRPSACAMSLEADVTDPEALRGAVRLVTERLGPVSVLVTAAGRHDAAPFGDMDDARWQGLLAVHLGGTVNACTAVLPGMLAAERGTIVTLSSWLALTGVAGESYQAAATGSIIGFTRSLAAEVAPRGLRVNCIAAPAGPGGAAAVADTVSLLVREGDFYVGQVFSPGAREAS